MWYKNKEIMTTQIEKTWNLEINGYTFTIQRNKRKDVFLSYTIVDTKNKGFIGTRKQDFLTLKGAKKHALEMINEYETFFGYNKSIKNVNK